MKLKYDNDADLAILDGKTVAVIGYGSQGRSQALNLRDSGVKVIVGVRMDGPSCNQAKEDGFSVYSFAEAAKRGDIIHILLPDEHHGPVYNESIRPNMKSGAALSCSHGFNIIYKEVVPPADSDVIIVAPKGPGSEVRRVFLSGFGLPGLYGAHQDVSGKAKEIALAMCKAEGLTRAGCLECTFEEETYEDLFGEQAVLCGGCVELVKTGFEVLTEAGYPGEMAYFEVLHELKLIVDLLYERGIQGMNEVISNTAEWGEYSTGPKIIDAGTKERMREALKRIESGEFAREFINEMRANGGRNIKAKRAALAAHPIEIVGKDIRKMFIKKSN
jgi:ketol-acid reductoisomerase